jgi:hypothetical protein
MTVTSSHYAKARSEIIALFGWSADGLTADQVLRIDCATALRLALDDLQGRIVRGESVDVARMLTASEALSRLLPPSALAVPPSEQHGDPRVKMFEIYMQMRERGEVPPEGWHQHRIKELEAENEALKARLAGGQPDVPTVVESTRSPASAGGSTAIDLAEADIVPPGERAECDPGVKPGPDDWRARRSPVTIEGKAVKPAPAAPAPRATPTAKPAWQDWLDAGGYGGPGFDRWSNRNF